MSSPILCSLSLEIGIFSLTQLPHIVAETALLRRTGRVSSARTVNRWATRSDDARNLSKRTTASAAEKMLASVLVMMAALSGRLPALRQFLLVVGNTFSPTRHKGALQKDMRAGSTKIDGVRLARCFSIDVRAERERWSERHKMA